MAREDPAENLDPDAACYYDRVGIDPRSEDVTTDVEKAYHAANDRRRDDEMSPKEFNRIKEARDLLRDEEEREQYDTFLEQYGRDAGTEAYHTWDDQNRPAPPEEWTPPSQSSSVGPESGRTPEESDEEASDDERATENRGRADPEREQTPDPDRRQQRRQRRNRDRPETNRDSGARTRERTRQRETTQQRETARQRERESTQSRDRTQPQPQPTEGSPMAAVEAATATKYRLGYLACALGIVTSLGLLVAVEFGLVQWQNPIGLVGLGFLATFLAALFVTRRWTSTVEATSAPDAIYDNVVLKPGLVKYAVLGGIALAILQTFVDGIVPEIVLTIIGILASVGLFLAPPVYIFTQTYDVGLDALSGKVDQS